MALHGNPHAYSLLDPANSVRIRVRMCLKLQMLHKLLRNQILTAAVVDHQFAYLAINSALALKDFLSLCIFRLYWRAQEPLNYTHNLFAFFFAEFLFTSHSDSSLPMLPHCLILGERC